jgi:hypothetical protein
MVPLSERRHRLYGDEIPEVIEGLRLRLEALWDAKEDSALRARARVALKPVTKHDLLNKHWARS